MEIMMDKLILNEPLNWVASFIIVGAFVLAVLAFVI